MSGANLEWVEQIWSGWSKFGVVGADVDRIVWRVANNLEKMLLSKILFSWAKHLKLDIYICWFSASIPIAISSAFFRVSVSSVSSLRCMLSLLSPHMKWSRKASGK